SPDGKLLLTWAADRTARLWDVATGLPACPPLVQAEELSHNGLGYDFSADFSRDGTRLVTVSQKPEPENNPTGPTTVLRLWEVPTGRPLREVPAHLSFALFSPDSKLLLYASSERALAILDADTGRSRGEPIFYEQGPDGVLFSPDSRVLVIPGRS